MAKAGRLSRDSSVMYVIFGKVIAWINPLKIVHVTESLLCSFLPLDRMTKVGTCMQWDRKKLKTGTMVYANQS